ncbi:MAG: hypothetical protein Fur0032_16670 [Terrimicrobiaceae bacterium]
MEIAQASPLWHAALLFGGLIFLLYQAWRGWRAGLVRSFVNLAALILSGVAGMLAGQLAGALMGGVGTLHGALAVLVAFAVVGLSVYLAIWLVGAILFKKTSQQSTALFRLFWGAGGAFFGLIFGGVFLWGAVSAIRALGTMADGQAATARAHDTAPPKVASGLVTLKESLEMGPTGKVLTAVDAVPPDLYELLFQISRLTSDPDAMARLIEYPEIQVLINHPRIVGLLGDPDIAEAAARKNFIGLMMNPSLMQAATDPDLAKKLSGIDLRKALAYALAEPSPSPAGLPEGASRP